MTQDFAHQLVVCIVNSGFSDAVMDAAKEAGARGGTIVGSRGTANKEAEKFFGITIQPDKEMVMILVPTDIRDDVMHALYKAVGLNTPGQGIAFALPVDNVVGLNTMAPTAAAQPAPQDSAQDAKPRRRKKPTSVDATPATDGAATPAPTSDDATPAPTDTPADNN